MKKEYVIFYSAPRIEWLLSSDEEGAGILCQSPQTGDLGEINIGSEEGEDEGWLN